ncbi:MAG: hypothetical protein NC079_04715 [Clostridium sp.]|nr:hypothetical protein [Acetatifactor muris]MCM1526289.1 hypothetical protein [Bacteroides sp.]MCM1562894.1 hypothetical protein [Clostridium sp.]
MRTERKRVRVLSLALAAMLVWEAAIPAQAAQTGATYEEYRTGGNTAQQTEYITVSISTEDELARLAADCGLDAWSPDKRVVLENDIRLEKYTNLMIPDFGGIFEGNGHMISGLRLNGTGSAVGLFRYVQEGAVVSNLTVQGRVEPEGSRGSVGGIAGVNYGTVSDCRFSGMVSGDTEIGGIVGSNMAGGEIKRCRSDAMVLGNHSTGGIAGSNNGTISHCQNYGEINTFTEEVRYDLDDITVERLEDINSTANVTAHTDTGGVAGISFGKMYMCKNYGTVGYSHVGYNVGGIVGRLSQGYLSGCVNEGHVLGRKDVGGIAGQMEPFLEVEYLTDKLQELDRETDKMFDLIDAAQEDLSDYGSQTTDALKSMTDHLDAAQAAAGSFMNTAEELWYIYNQELGGIGRDLRDTVEPEDGEDKDAGNAGEPGTSNEEDSEGNSEDTAGEPDVSEAEDLGTPEPGIAGEPETSDIGDRYPEINLDNVVSRDDLESYKAALRKFGDDAGAHLQNMANASTDRNEGLSNDLSTFNEELRKAGEDMDSLTALLEAEGESMDSHADAIREQAKVLRNLVQGIRDDLFAYEGIVVEDASDESAGEGEGNLLSEEETSEDPYGETYYDTTDFKKGKIESCRNEGAVEADTAVGGIVGQIAIEYDLDPEDDLNYTGEESFNIERKVKAVVRESLNRGDVTGKRDYVGGIVGKADFGAVISCESYGNVESAGGSKVGGVAGASQYAVRGCYSLGRVAGKNQVGGIVGKGCDVLGNYAYNRMEVSGECGGAIAGILEDAGTLFGNYYVENGRGGVDGIGYQGGATPLSYEQFIALREVPEMFSRFRVAFCVEGVELAAMECGYGEAVSEELIPDIPQKEGFYGIWPETDLDRITGNETLEAEYVRWLGSLAGEEQDAQGRSLILVEGEFLPGARLETVTEGDTTEISVTQPVLRKGRIREEYEEYRQPVTVRILCEDGDAPTVEVERDGVFAPVDTQVMGSYLIFAMERPGIYRVTVSENHDMMILVIAVAVLAVAALLVAGRLIWMRRKRRRLSAPESDGVKNSESDGAKTSESDGDEDLGE